MSASDTPQAPRWLTRSDARQPFLVAVLFVAGQQARALVRGKARALGKAHHRHGNVRIVLLHFLDQANPVPVG